ncbi:MAG: YkgJ family cysteine cluster protein [Desulfurococcaceae archaeon]|jgi:Fe-S-cluster containining protein
MSPNPVVKLGERLAYTCIRCGKCCSSGPNVSLTVFDVCRIAKYLGAPWRELAGKSFYVVIADYVPVIVLRGIGGRCVFLKYVNNLPTCTVYPARPARCRLYPFIPIAPRVEDSLEVSSACPGVGRGELAEPPWDDLKEYLSEVRKHYELLYKHIFEEGYEPLSALEKALDQACG